MKDKRESNIFNAFQKISNRKPKKIWVDQEGKFYNYLFKRFLKNNKIEIAKRFMRPFKNEVYKHIAAVSKNVYFDVFDDFVNKYNDTVHRTIKMTSIDDISDSYAEYNKDSNKKDPKFKVGDHVITSKYKGIFAKRFCY